MALTLDDVLSRKISKFINCFEFKYCDIAKKYNYHCKIQDCKKFYRDKSGAIRHIHTHHKEYYDVISDNRKRNDKSVIQTNLIDIKASIDPEIIWNACAELICVNSLPLAFVEFPSMKKLLAPYIIGLKRSGHNLAINSKNIKKRIHCMSDKITSKIREDVKGKMVAVMADIGSRYSRSILGVSIRYMNERKLKVQTIGMHVLKYAHTAEYIADKIKNNLSEFGIQLHQTVSVTTDNGKNMVKSVSVLDSVYQESKEVDTDDENSDEASDIDEHIDSEIFDDVYYGNLLSEMRSTFSDTFHTDIIHGICCAAHCIHLVVTQAIEKSPQTKFLVDRARRLAKTLRTPRVRSMIIARGMNMALLDVVTRWNSIFVMVNKEKHVLCILNF